jgi:DNA polymerase-4
MKKIIFQLDLDAFFASVEELENPELKTKPIAVGHEMNGKGIITTANYIARKFGLHSAMPVFKARQLCPQVIIIESDYQKYTDKSEEVFTIVKNLVNKIEMASIDEAYVDVTKIINDKNLNPISYAKHIQSEVLKKTGLGISIGISENRVLAKMASGMKKPLGVTTL